MSPRRSTASLRLAGLVLVIDAIVLFLFSGSILWFQLFGATISLTPEGVLVICAAGAGSVAAFIGASQALRGRAPARLPSAGVAGLLGVAALLVLADGGSDQRAELAFALAVALAQILILVAVFRAPGRSAVGTLESAR